MLCVQGEPVPRDELIHPRAEPEIAFLIGESLMRASAPGQKLRELLM